MQNKELYRCPTCGFVSYCYDPKDGVTLKCPKCGSEWRIGVSIGVPKANERLKELVEADSEGRALILPCNVGDTVYRVYTRSHVARDKVVSFEVNECGNLTFRDDSGRVTDCRVFGLYVFRSREEAENALKEGLHHE